MEDINDIDFIYNTRTRNGEMDDDFHSRIASALLFDIDIENNDVEREEENAEVRDDEDGNFLIEEDASDVENVIDIEPNEVFDSDEEIENDDTPNEPANITTTGACFYGKDGTVWEKDEPTVATRFASHNVMIPIEVFKKLLSPNMTYIIITETNRHGSASYAKWNQQNAHLQPQVWIDMTATELDAFIGILIAGGVTHNNMQFAPLLWKSDALPIFRAAMSLKRFKILTRFIRFDDSRTRAFRLQTDKAAPIRDLWNYMNENLANNYEPYENITIDEQLFPYRGKTRFTQFIPSKPSKYGIKIWWACDAKTKYPLQGLLYTGKDHGAPREVNQGENVLMKLSMRYQGTGRTIITDNFFTTLEGAKRLCALGLAYTGTIRSNKKCLLLSTPIVKT